MWDFIIIASSNSPKHLCVMRLLFSFLKSTFKLTIQCELFTILLIMQLFNQILPTSMNISYSIVILLKWKMIWFSHTHYYSELMIECSWPIYEHNQGAVIDGDKTISTSAWFLFLRTTNINKATKGPRNSASTQVFCTNNAQKLPEIHVHAKFTKFRWMPDWFFMQ